MGKLIDLEEQVFNRLTVRELAAKPWKDTRSEWICLCQCGKETRVKGNFLVSGKTQSCGCLRSEPSAVLPRTGGKVIHGHAGGGKSPTYRSWEAMKRRCLNPKANTYKYYGARGISIDPRWIDSFETFLREMGERPEGMTLDRLDNEAGYSKSNCVWSTPAQQMSHTRRSK